MRNKVLLYILQLLVLLTSCQEEGEIIYDHGSTTTYKVAVIMPSYNHEWAEQIVDLACNNIAHAQQGFTNKVAFDVLWINEDDTDMLTLAEKAIADETIKAIIGPKYSVNARKVASLCHDNKKTIILPVATSVEFQRIFADKEYVWNLTQSDITQSELLISQAVISGCKQVALICADDDYGKSFSDWFAYQAVELGVQPVGIYTYHDNNDLENAALNVSQFSNEVTLIFAPAQARDAVILDDIVGHLQANGHYDFPKILCSDNVNDVSIATKIINTTYEGVSACADPSNGFEHNYMINTGHNLPHGAAHLYDAFMLLAYALTIDNGNLNHSIKQIVDGREQFSGCWLPVDMARAFTQLQQGRTPDLRGVTGEWRFDEKWHASPLSTSYSHWILTDGEFKTIEYLSTDKTGRTTSTMQLWDMHSTVMQQFDDTQREPDYPPQTGNWAVVVATSNDWVNYRHQADALAMYQLLRRHGYEDDHIILIMQDNIAYDPHNIYPGEVRVYPDGENIYQDVVADYHINDISIQDFANIMTGNATPQLPTVLNATSGDNVIVFWCGHGYFSHLAWGNTSVTAGEVANILNRMQQGQCYRKLLFVVDACYSGSIGLACNGIPGALFITAATDAEPSKADIKDTRMGIWLSNGFTRAFQETIDTNPTITLRQLYYTLARSTVGSHATIYNADHYGNLYNNSIKEFFNED